MVRSFAFSATIRSRTGICLIAFLAVMLAASCSKHKPTLNLLVWEGYADPTFIKAFEQQCNCTVNAAYMGSSDELVAKLRGGGASNYDVISPSSDVAASLVKGGLVAPLDLAKIPSYQQTSQKLRDEPIAKMNGQVYGVPFVWGPNPLLYDTTYYKTPPQSWSDLWDPKLKGKISVWDELSTMYMAAQVLGYDNPPSELYQLNDDQLEKVKAKLLELKPNVRKMWATGGELTNLFENHEVVAAMGWPLMTNQLRTANFPIGETIPKENTTGWIDHLMITSASDNKDLAYQFLEYMTQAKTQKLVSDVTKYTPANPNAALYMSEEQKKAVHLDNVDEYQKHIYFWQDVPRRAKYNEIWNQVKAAQ